MTRVPSALDLYYNVAIFAALLMPFFFTILSFHYRLTDLCAHVYIQWYTKTYSDTLWLCHFLPCYNTGKIFFWGGVCYSLTVKSKVVSGYYGTVWITCKCNKEKKNYFFSDLWIAVTTSPGSKTFTVSTIRQHRLARNICPKYTWPVHYTLLINEGCSFVVRLLGPCNLINILCISQ